MLSVLFFLYITKKKKKSPLGPFTFSFFSLSIELYYILYYITLFYILYTYTYVFIRNGKSLLKNISFIISHARKNVPAVWP